MWKNLQIVLVVIGLLLVFAGDRLVMPLLVNAGIACLGLLSMAVGWEAILTRQIVVGRRRSRIRETYTGVAAIYQGVLFNVLGLFLIVVAYLSYTNNNGREFFQQIVRRPGLALIFLGGICLMQAVINIVGPVGRSDNSGWGAILNLLLTRLFPGLILILIGLGAMGLGLFEVAAPEVFDARGGGFLETLYGLR